MDQEIEMDGVADNQRQGDKIEDCIAAQSSKAVNLVARTGLVVSFRFLLPLLMNPGMGQVGNLAERE